MRIAEDPELALKCEELTEPGADLFRSSMSFASDSLVPNDPEDIVDWAAANLTLPTAVSARSGPLELNPVQAAIARLWQTPGIRQVTFLKPPRFGSTLLNAAGLLYFSGHEGHDVIFYERSEGDAQDFHDKKLFPIIENSPPIAALKRPDTKYGVQDAWSDRILTNGASVQLRSASNNGSFRAIKGLFIVVDEAGSKEYKDRSKNSEGSKIDLIRRRAQEFAAPVLYIGGTPTTVGDDMCWDEYTRSDKRKFVMPCPHCAEFIAFEPDVRRALDREVRYGTGMRYLVGDGDLVTDVWYECECGARITEDHKIGMMEAGRLEATAIGEPGHAGIYCWAAYSTDLQMGWRQIATEHQRSLRSPEAVQPYINLILAQPFDPSPIRDIDPTSLEGRAEAWARPDGSRADAPEWAEALFAGVDAQQGSLDDQSKPPRLEMTIHAIGKNRRRAVIGHHIISHRDVIDRLTGEIERVPVEPFTAACADMLWDLIERDYVTEDGRSLRIKRTFVDNGWRPDDAQRFCKLKRSKDAGILPIRGHSGERNGSRQTLLPVNLMLAKGRKSGREFLPIGTQTAKDTLGRLLGIPAPGPESIVFSADLGRDYFEGLLAEHLVEIRPGVRRWEPVSAKNTGEPLDCLVYSYAAERYEMRKNARLKKLVDAIDPEAADAALAVQAATQSENETPAPPADDATTTAVHSAVEMPQPESEKSGVRFRVVRRVRRENASDRPDGAPSDRVQRVRRRKTGIGW